MGKKIIKSSETKSGREYFINIPTIIVLLIVVGVVIYFIRK